MCPMHDAIMMQRSAFDLTLAYMLWRIIALGIMNELFPLAARLGTVKIHVDSTLSGLCFQLTYSQAILLI